MRLRKSWGLVICLLVGIALWKASPVGACDPEGENLANQASDPQCRLVLSTVRAPSPVRVALASANLVAGMVDYSTNPACFLPNGSSNTNLLGVTEGCPPPYLPPHTIATPVATATPVAKATPRGDSPHSARTMTGEWETIPPGGQVWYRIDNGNNFFLNIWMDTYGKPGVVFNVYSPEQINDLAVSTPPKGRSAPSKEGHDWGWKGAQAMGLWHVVVINTTNTPMQYRIHYQQTAYERECRGYWEWLPTGQYVYWIACRDYGP